MQETKTQNKRDIQGWLEVGSMEATSRMRLMVDMPQKKSSQFRWFFTLVPQTAILQMFALEIFLMQPAEPNYALSWTFEHDFSQPEGLAKPVIFKPGYLFRQNRHPVYEHG